MRGQSQTLAFHPEAMMHPPTSASLRPHNPWRTNNATWLSRLTIANFMTSANRSLCTTHHVEKTQGINLRVGNPLALGLQTEKRTLRFENIFVRVQNLRFQMTSFLGRAAGSGVAFVSFSAALLPSSSGTGPDLLPTHDRARPQVQKISRN